MCIADAAPIDSAIVSPYTISWDANSNGQIQDGGGDMYDGGNRITTSLCGSQLSPYTDNMQEIASDCFGAGGSYMMDIRTSMMVLLSQNTGDADLTISISGNLGADGGGSHVASEYSSKRYKSSGLLKSNMLIELISVLRLLISCSRSYS